MHPSTLAPGLAGSFLGEVLEGVVVTLSSVMYKWGSLNYTK